jgi:hypothetical protein
MAKSEPTSDTRSPQSLVSLPRFQFSLAWLLIALTVVAVILGLGASLGPVIGVALFVLNLIVRCVVPTPLVICAIFARGQLRAAAIGALMPFVAILPWEAQSASLIALTLTVVCSAVCGFLAAATWRWIRRMERQ